MFTGLVQVIAEVTAVRPDGDGMRLDVDLGGLQRAHLGGPQRAHLIGDSIALSGVCCTVVALDGAVAAFDLTAETLARTWLGRLRPGDRLNLEPALRAGDPLGGHLVQGHVDGICTVTAPIDASSGGELLVQIPAELRRYCVEKGSITLDGVSLTVASFGPDRQDGQIRIAIIPHTAQITTLGTRKAGDPLHVEVDVLAKYVESMLSARDLA